MKLPFDFTRLAREMDAARTLLDSLPENEPFTQQQIDALEDMRHSAIWLSEVAEATADAAEAAQAANKTSAGA